MTFITAVQYNFRFSTKYDLTIVGGGIVGLATARELLLRFPQYKVAVLEKETEVGEMKLCTFFRIE